jgi:hypothetical protein
VRWGWRGETKTRGRRDLATEDNIREVSIRSRMDPANRPSLLTFKARRREEKRWLSCGLTENETPTGPSRAHTGSGGCRLMERGLTMSGQERSGGECLRLGSDGER